MYISKKKQNKKSGFTLIEMLVAVLIFSMSLAALLSISAQGLKLARSSEKQLVADYLALEAMEFVRNQRDSAFLSNGGKGIDKGYWESKVLGGPDRDCVGSSDTECNLFLQGGSLDIGGCEKCIVYFNPDRKMYFQRKNDSSPDLPSYDSGYRRYIKINHMTDTQIMASVRVFWDDTGGKGEVAYTENLFLWQ
ncbi:MAG: type IV pilus modification PilV family protein [Minisyncoccia bacterium]